MKSKKNKLVLATESHDVGAEEGLNIPHDAPLP